MPLEVISYTYIQNTIFALGGFIVGHRFALYRDRRKEFNTATELLRNIVTKEINKTSKGCDSINDTIITELDMIEPLINPFNRNCYNWCKKEYQQQIDEKGYIDENENYVSTRDINFTHGVLLNIKWLIKLK
jgi:hypothetical protein